LCSGSARAHVSGDVDGVVVVVGAGVDVVAGVAGVGGVVDLAVGGDVAVAVAAVGVVVAAADAAAAAAAAAAVDTIDITIISMDIFANSYVVFTSTSTNTTMRV
jgi:hypothetical protein